VQSAGDSSTHLEFNFHFNYNTKPVHHNAKLLLLSIEHTCSAHVVTTCGLQAQNGVQQQDDDVSLIVVKQ
jgi:hypothetical protein